MSFPIAPILTSEQAIAQKFCESEGGNLPFFNNENELAEWQKRPDPQREWLGIVRNEAFESGWAKVTGEQATVFAWARGEPDLNKERCATTMIDAGGIDYNNPFVWNDVPCMWVTETFRCRIDSIVNALDKCPEIILVEKIASDALVKPMDPSVSNFKKYFISMDTKTYYSYKILWTAHLFHVSFF